MAEELETVGVGLDKETRDFLDAEQRELDEFLAEERKDLATLGVGVDD